GLELADQVGRGELPEPRAVFLPYGTGGTAVGLALGLQLGGLASRVVAVRVIVEREREIRAFVPEESWKLVAYLAGGPDVCGKRLARPS
ncbi:MAG: hypothetical protein P8Y53_12425, partial [Pseudolabrys sp.]